MIHFAERLKGVDGRLVTIIFALHTDVAVICGRRGKAAQDQAFSEGRSKLKYPYSMHNAEEPDLSEAVDLCPWPIDWTDVEAFCVLAGAVKQVAAEKGFEIRWGGDWDSDGSTTDESFRDYGHFELAKKKEIAMLTSKGWKGITAGVGMMLFALIGGILGMVGFVSPITLDITAAITMFMSGLGILGIRVAIGGTPPTP